MVTVSKEPGIYYDYENPHRGTRICLYVCVCVCEGCRSNCIQYCPYLCTQTDVCDNQKGLFKMSGHNYAAYVDDKQVIIFVYL